LHLLGRELLLKAKFKSDIYPDVHETVNSEGKNAAKRRRVTAITNEFGMNFAYLM
jgi:hypothetical protein